MDEDAFVGLTRPSVVFSYCASVHACVQPLTVSHLVMRGAGIEIRLRSALLKLELYTLLVLHLT